MTDQSIIRVFPGWRVVREIGAGGFGKVYEIERDRFGKIEKAAVKVMNIPNDRSVISEMCEDGYDDESIKSRLKSDMDTFAMEYDNMRKVVHTNIVNCDDIEYVTNTDGSEEEDKTVGVQGAGTKTTYNNDVNNAFEYEAHKTQKTTSHFIENVNKANGTAKGCLIGIGFLYGLGVLSLTIMAIVATISAASNNDWSNIGMNWTIAGLWDAPLLICLLISSISEARDKKSKK